MHTHTKEADIATSRVVLSVSQLNREVRGMLESGLPLLWVEGEISNLARPASGHIYFTLKDSKAQIRCALFKARGRLLSFRPENGTQVLVRGRVSLYEPRGDYQLIAESMEQGGDGALRRQFEVLKARLGDEGLFDPERKQPLPTMPRRIGVITSPSGAAIRDVLHVMKRRFPGIAVLIYPVPVQGKDAAKDIAAMIGFAAERAEVDALLLTRGGGSLEDLQPFNEEIVARAISACRLPLVSAIGHEIDFTIADFVADQRAPTPSAAAELLSPDGIEWLARFQRSATRLTRLVADRLQRLQVRLLQAHGRLGRQHPGRRIRDHAQRLDELDLRLRNTWRITSRNADLALAQLRRRLAARDPRQRIHQDSTRCRSLHQRLLAAQRRELARHRHALGSLARNLETVSPLATVSRGYAIVQTPDGRVLRRADSVLIGDTVTARLASGRLSCRVERVEPET
ncbi:MAG: exodeoxyribonuclease VII large subunit [Aquisalimonadaceae bacterium]